MDLREETIESNIVYDGKLVKLRKDRVRLPNGRETTREIVVHRGAVALVPIIDNDKIIMVRQFRLAAGEVLLEVPAGTLNEGEDPFDCAQRELEEEICYHPNKLTLMYTSYLAPGYSTEKMYTYLAEDLVKKCAESDADEFIETIEIPLNDAVELISNGEIRDSKTISAIMMAQKVLASRK